LDLQLKPLELNSIFKLTEKETEILKATYYKYELLSILHTIDNIENIYIDDYVEAKMAFDKEIENLNKKFNVVSSPSNYVDFKKKIYITKKE